MNVSRCLSRFVAHKRQNIFSGYNLVKTKSSYPIKPLDGRIAVVTGASRGVGRGIALQLGEAGATVYVTGRLPNKSLSAIDKSIPTLQNTAEEITRRGGKGVAVHCDHALSSEVTSLFDKIDKENEGRLDILVNSAFSGIASIEANAGKKFFECDISMWDDVNNVGLRNVYVCNVLAARLMSSRKCGLIVNVSSAGGIQYFLSVAYGVGKAAIDRMTADIALELRPYNVAAVSIWPGTVKTELSNKLIKSGKFSELTGLKQDLLDRLLENGETPEFCGRAVVALACDPKVIEKTGRILLTADLSSKYGFTDIDGKIPPNIRSVNSALDFFGWPTLAKIVPSFIKVPALALHLSSYKF